MAHKSVRAAERVAKGLSAVFGALKDATDVLHRISRRDRHPHCSSKDVDFCARCATLWADDAISSIKEKIG